MYFVVFTLIRYCCCFDFFSIFPYLFIVLMICFCLSSLLIERTVHVCLTTRYGVYATKNNIRSISLSCEWSNQISTGMCPWLYILFCFVLATRRRRFSITFCMVTRFMYRNNELIIKNTTRTHTQPLTHLNGWC